jgi:hypothetical protein
VRLPSAAQINTMREKEVQEMMKDRVVGATDGGAPVAFRCPLRQLFRGILEFARLHGHSRTYWNQWLINSRVAADTTSA